MKTQLLKFGIVVLVIVLAASAVLAVDYFNGFENNLHGWYFVNADGSIARAASGTNGIPSARGSNHAVVSRVGESPTIWGGVFTNWGGYANVFPANGYITQIDLYLDMALADGSDKRLDFSSAVNDVNGNLRRDFVFHIGTIPGEEVSNQWSVSASTMAVGEPTNPAGNPLLITNTGWYTFQHIFENVDGVLRVTMKVFDQSGTMLGQWMLSDLSDVIGSTVGGNRYGWFMMQRFDFTDIAIDNARAYDLLIAPESGEDCLNNGWQQFGFESQEDCLATVPDDEAPVVDLPELPEDCEDGAWQIYERFETLRACIIFVGGEVESPPEQPEVIVLPETMDDCKNDGWQDYGVFKNQGDCIQFVNTGKYDPSNPGNPIDSPNTAPNNNDNLPDNKDQCKNGGWQDFGRFKNQGDCIQFVNTGK